MLTLEQAIFTAADSPQRATGLPTSVSAGIQAADLRELAQWNAAALAAAESINFHPLPSGTYCVSHTVPLDGGRTWTHCLVAAPQVLSRFANHPLALLHAAQAAGLTAPGAAVPARLPPLAVEPRVAVVDQALLTRLAPAGGAARLGALAQAALEHGCLAVAAGGSAIVDWIAGLMSCLPIECRPEFSFCTGLRFSPTRSYRIFGWPGPSEELHILQLRYNLGVLDLTPDAPPPPRASDGWGRLVERVLASGEIAFLATQFAKRRFELTPRDLPALALQLAEDFEAGVLRGDDTARGTPAQRGAVRSEILQCAHAPHPSPRAQSTAAPVLRLAGPAQTIGPDSPEVMAKLETLDDVVWEAVGGGRAALEKLQQLWPRLRSELGDELLAESREQYLRYALSIWEQYMGDGGARNPTQAVHALDVLCVLFDRT